MNNVCRKISYMLSLHRKSLTFDVLKMLSESRILSRIDYTLPVWGTPLNRSQMARLQRLQNRAIHVTKCLRKYDHISLHRLQLNWLPISHQIMFKSSCAMYHYYHYGHQPCLIFDPPIVFGAHHSYNTRCKYNFAKLLTCYLSSTKMYFCSSAFSWWNSLIATVPIYCTYTSLSSFVLSIRNFYYNNYVISYLFMFVIVLSVYCTVCVVIRLLYVCLLQ